MVDNIYPPGQCTYGAAEEANWVLMYGNLGNAKDWARNWASHGGQVVGAPVVGAVACFQPGQDGADAPYGHVGVVVAVQPGSFTLSEMNGPAGPGRFDNRVCADVSGIQYLLPPAAPAPPPPAPPSPVPAGTPIWVNFAGVVQVQTANVRFGPSTVYGIYREVHSGQRLGFDGYAYGPAVYDPVARQEDHRWFHINQASGEGWVASALINGNPPNSHP